MKKIIKYKNREEWLKNRSKGIGASEAGTVLGLNPFETPYQLWRRKKGMDPPKQENFAMVAGHILEDAVAQFFARESHCHIIKASTDDYTILNTDNPIMRVSPDRTFWRVGARHNEASKSILECKTTQLTIDPDDLPKHWFCQIQMNLGVGEYKDGALAWLTQGREFGCVDIDFDFDFFGWMEDEIKKFWFDYVEGDKEPPAINASDIMLKYPLHNEGKTVTADAEILEQLARLKEIKSYMGTLDKEKDEIEDNLKLFFGDAECIVDQDGRKLATWRSPKPRMAFDKVLFENTVGPAEYNKYCHEVNGTRRLLIK